MRFNHYMLPLILLVTACGGPSLDVITENEIETGYVSDEEKLRYLKTVLTDLYEEREIDTAYITSIAGSVYDERTYVDVDRPIGNINMIGMATIEQIEEDGNNWAIGIMETTLSFENNTFDGSIYDIKQVNTYLETTIDEFSGELVVSGNILDHYMSGNAMGTLTNRVGENIVYNFELSGGLIRPEEGGRMQFSGGLDQINGDLTGRFITVRK